MPEVALRRLNVNLPEPLYVELQGMAKQSNRSLTDVIRLALGLVRVVLEETAKNGNHVYIGRKDGTILKELVLPQY